jgi:diketogulonate reductase-like aldo/keto reductase
MAAAAAAPAQLPTRPIPKTGEALPVMGLGSTKAVMSLPEHGSADFEAVLRLLLEYGARVVDTWSRDPALEELAGVVLRKDDMVQRLFLCTKIDADGRDAGRALLEQTERIYGKAPDLIQVFNLRDVATHWPLLQEWRAGGRARYLGVTVSADRDHAAVMDFMRANQPDFIQVNYSVLEPAAEQAVLPLAADLGVAVIVNRPFMNGEYFPRVNGKALPAWAADFDCESWAQFSLKYVLAHPAVTCVLTETTNPRHLLDNLGAAQGRLPDAATRQRMREHMRTL